MTPSDNYASETNKERQKINDLILEKVAKNPLLHQFTDVYLSSLTNRSLSNEEIHDFQNFIEQRFKTFEKVIKSKKEFLLTIKEDKEHNKVQFEIVTEDAQYLIFTLECVFKQFDLKVTKMFHPLLSVDQHKGKLTHISKPSARGRLVSLPFFECEGPEDKNTLKDIEAELTQRIKAVLHAKYHYTDIIKHLKTAQKEVAAHPTPNKDFQSEWVELIDWLANENFSFFGYGRFILSTQKGKKSVKVDQKAQFGILDSKHIKESNSKLLTVLKKQIIDMADYRSPFIFDAIRINSPIKRSEKLMRLSLKIPGKKKGEWIEHNFLGLLKRSSLFAKNLETPIIKLRLIKIFKNKHFMPGSHNYYQTIRFCNNIPKYELFRTPTENLQKMVEDLISISSYNTSFVFSREKIDKSKLFLLVVLPKDLYSLETEEKVVSLLKDKIPNEGCEFLSIPGDQFYRLHIYFDQPNLPDWKPDIQELERLVKNSTKTWKQRLHDAIFEAHPEKEAEELYRRYQEDFPVHHQVRRSPENTVEDIHYFERLKASNTVQFNLIPFTFKESVLSDKASVLLIYHFKKIDLYTFIPIFRNLRLYFYDELTTRIGSIHNIVGYIHAFRICNLDGSNIDVDTVKPLLVDLLTALFLEKLPNDPLNGLVATAKLNWKQIFVLQAYRNYLLQLKPNYTKEKIDNSLLDHAEATTLLVKYFEEKFKVTRSHKPSTAQVKRLNDIESDFIDCLNSVSDIDDDYILKWFLNILKHTIRCNYNPNTLEDNAVLAFKFDCKGMKLPQPKPFKEIFVFGNELEGIHIRFGPVSRGGIRWSNRLDDYRSEVLGLASTQRVKNVVIVPNGSKGGFVIKKYDESADRVQESERQYKQFINALLSITDSVDERNNIIHSENSTAYDKQDPYLVVAADKGTANFSDTANAISQERDFWLDDAFASGGSNGYNHKELGITAKGAWECVKLHFLERNKDIQKEEFTVVGVGDMSGDVFGNGMLLSKKIRLIAAFNHIEIFIDPNPNAEKSWKERKRLFNTPGSKWSDYSKSALSKGANVYQRKAKKIQLTPEIKALLNCDKDELNGEELIKEILKLKVELLWFAGIGTYIKSKSQTHFEVGDIANNSVRIDDQECQATVIGEGANLGMTQDARFKLSRRGTQLNTDFIDNSAGVNISDYEVNLKLFLSQMLRQKTLKDSKERATLLKKATDEVIEKVLTNNELQHQLISIEEIRSRKAFSRYESFIQLFVKQGKINPDIDTIPKQSALNDLEEKGAALPRPLLAFLQSLVKLEVYETCAESSQLDHPLFNDLFLSYFPDSFHKRFGDKLFSHPLKREITATLLTNYVVNNAGILFFSLIQEITGRDLIDIVVTYFILNKLFSCDEIRAEIQSKAVSFNEKYKLLIALEDALRNSIIDTLLLKAQAFSLKNFEDIDSQFKAFKKEVMPKLKGKVHVSGSDELDGFQCRQHFIAIYNSKCLKKKMSASQIQTYIHANNVFDFNNIRYNLNTITLSSGWEVEEYMLLQKLLSQKSLELIQRCLSKSSTKVLQEDDFSDMFSKDFSKFKHNLDLLKRSEKPCISSLNVLINQLNIL